ncbi:hypothetical protein L596_009670 [Steinernema carpocapsae]|uniref:Uncharacterized protein n=1 Tax=Steinernema carpocapsae TaxID=34508 RepID=A0A4U5PG05_STECR|nr:hypothetical protein L596_009670 [Steinernema carpocapsae]
MLDLSMTLGNVPFCWTIPRRDIHTGQPNAKVQCASLSVGRRPSWSSAGSSYTSVMTIHAILLRALTRQFSRFGVTRVCERHQSNWAERDRQRFQTLESSSEDTLSESSSQESAKIKL